MSNATYIAMIWILGLLSMNFIAKKSVLAKEETAKFVSCSQSSNYASWQSCDKARDGKYSSCRWEDLAHTIREPKSWWIGHLSEPTAIGKVRITGRSDYTVGVPTGPHDFKIILDRGQVCAEYPSQEFIIDKTFSCVGVTTDVKVQMNGKKYLALCEVIAYKQEITATITTITTTDEGNTTRTTNTTTTSQNNENYNTRLLFIIILPCIAGGISVLLILFCLYAKCRTKIKKKNSEALNDKLNEEKPNKEERERKKQKKRSKKLQRQMRDLTLPGFVNIGDNADDSDSDKSGKSKASNQSSKSSGSAKSSDSTNI